VSHKVTQIFDNVAGSYFPGSLQRISRILLAPLEAAQTLIGARSYSIAITFPWAGVQVGLAW
jgi:hypothetical protein